MSEPTFKIDARFFSEIHMDRDGKTRELVPLERAEKWFNAARNERAYAGLQTQALGSLQEMLAKQVIGLQLGDSRGDGLLCNACGGMNSHYEDCPVEVGLGIIEAALAANPVTEICHADDEPSAAAREAAAMLDSLPKSVNAVGTKSETWRTDEAASRCKWLSHEGKTIGFDMEPLLTLCKELERSLSQYSLPAGAWVEHGGGWVKVHALQSTEAAKELCKFLESAQGNTQ